MKNNMDEIDVLIKETLTQEETKFYNVLEEQNLFAMIFGLFLYCLVQFFKAEVTKELLKWGFGSVIFMLSVSMLKVFAWMQMDKNAILRELKRLELLISSLASKI